MRDEDRLVKLVERANKRVPSEKEIEEAMKGLNREELAKLASYIAALCVTRADPIIALTHVN